MTANGYGRQIAVARGWIGCCRQISDDVRKLIMGLKLFLLASLGGAAIATAAPALADTRTGVDAWTRGDFATAVKAWQVEAARGEPMPCSTWGRPTSWAMV
jgi:hypothetical protein